MSIYSTLLLIYIVQVYPYVSCVFLRLRAAKNETVVRLQILAGCYSNTFLFIYSLNNQIQRKLLSINSLVTFLKLIQIKSFILINFMLIYNHLFSPNETLYSGNFILSK